MMRVIGWLCYRIVMALPIPLPDCRENYAFAWILARAGEYADQITLNVRAKPPKAGLQQQGGRMVNEGTKGGV